MHVWFLVCCFPMLITQVMKYEFECMSNVTSLTTVLELTEMITCYAFRLRLSINCFALYIHEVYDTSYL